MRVSGQGILGVDIGGSSVKAAPVSIADGKFLSDPMLVETPADATPDMLAETIRELAVSFYWNGPVGVGYPGIVKDGEARLAAHVSKECLGVNLADLFSRKTGLPVNVLNDADAAGLAEMRFGAGKGHNQADGGVVLMLTFGTGIGSAVFIGGRLLPNTEFGHLQVEGTEAEDLAAASVRVRQNLSWENWSTRVNLVLAEYELLLSPDLIIFGGGITDNFEQFGGLLHTQATLVPASLGNRAGILGAALAAGSEH